MPVTYLEAIRQGLWEELERDPAVFCMGEDIGVYGGAFKVTEGMIDRFGPERIIDMPIAESAIVGAAFGAALLGMRPVAEFQFMDFIGCAFNQITNMIAKAHYRWGAPAPVVLRGPSGGGVHGGPFHSQNPEMHFVHTPGLKVVCPGTPTDAYGLIKSAIRDNNPVIFFEHKFLYRRLKEELPIADDFTVPLGKARIAREGKHVSVITYAAMLQVALEAASILATEAIELEILDLRTLMPLDRKAIADTVRKTNLAIILHEDTKTGGIAGEIAAIINEEAFDYLDGPIVRITSLDTPVPFSPPLEHEFLPSVRDVVEKARWLKRQAQPSLETPSRSSQRVVPAETEIHPGKIVPMSAARRQWAQAAVHSKRVCPHRIRSGFLSHPAISPAVVVGNA
jgi:2-oxoisovalerate dehydrogenase E1 component beta subunit